MLQLSQGDVAERAAIEVSTVSRIETGNLNPSIEVLDAVARGLSTSIGSLVDEDEVDLTVDLADDEVALIRRYRALSSREKRVLTSVLDALRDEK